MDTIENTLTRNYRRFTVTKVRGGYNYELGNYGNGAQTLKSAYANIDRIFDNYDKAVATLAEIGNEPTATADIIRYRELKMEFTRAQDKVASSSGMQSSSLSLWRGETLEDELAKAEAMLQYRKDCIAEVERLIELIRNLPTNIAEQDSALSTLEFRYYEAKRTVAFFAFLDN